MLLTLAAYDGSTFTGIVRTVGDGQTVVFIQNLLVHPDHRRKGTGIALLSAVLNRYPNVRRIELAADDTPELRAFYTAAHLQSMSSLGCTGWMRA